MIQIEKIEIVEFLCAILFSYSRKHRNLATEKSMGWAMSAYLTSWLATFLELPIITQWAIVLIALSALLVHFVFYNARTAHDAPSIFTTTGIFFTFVGIAEGLLSFNANEIEASVPALLSGLKTAFVASVVGVGAALSIKL